jgi:hypothetical protein
VFLSSLWDFGFVVHPFPAINRWAIIISPYGTRLLLNTSGLSEKAPLFKGEIANVCWALPVLRELSRIKLSVYIELCRERNGG